MGIEKTTLYLKGKVWGSAQSSNFEAWGNTYAKRVFDSVQEEEMEEEEAWFNPMDDWDDGDSTWRFKVPDYVPASPPLHSTMHLPIIVVIPCIPAPP